MILKIHEIGLSIEVDDELMDSIVSYGFENYPNEFGGFLIGYYENEYTHLHITDSILPLKFNASKFTFTRSTKGLGEKLDAFYHQVPKKYYVGEWHTHPDYNAIPSSTDISAVKAIVNDKNASLANPVLLIIGYSKIQVDFGFYVWFNNRLYKYE